MTTSAPIAGLDVNKISANEAQGVFLTAEGFELLYDGGAGNGKTTAGCLRALKIMLDRPGSSGMIARYEMPELRTTTMKDFMDIVESSLPTDYIKRFNDQHGILVLKNGSTCIFRGLAFPPSQYGKLKNFNLGWIFIDQLEDIHEEVYLLLLQRLRHPAGPREIFSTANPAGHNWVWRHFIRKVPVLFKDDKIEVSIGDELFRVGASTEVNRHNLPPSYIERLKKRYPEYLAKRYIEGSWDAFEGQIFPSFDEDLHVVADHSPPSGVRRFVAIDHGISAPSCALFFYVHANGDIVVYDEYYQIHHSVTYHKARIREKASEPDLFDYWRLDPQCWANTLEKDGDPWSVADEYSTMPNGIPVTKANNDWEASVVHLILYFEEDPDHINPFTQKMGAPHIYVCERCENLIETLPGYIFDPKAVERGEDKVSTQCIRHAVDSLRYGVMSRPEPKKLPQRTMVEGSPEYYRKMIKRAKKRGGIAGWRRAYASA